MTDLFETQSRPVPITKEMVRAAYRKVKSNQGSAGVDGQDFTEFDKNLLANLYKIWNRLSSGSYFPPPVKEVIIPKANGGERRLGIPTIGDRIAQQVIKAYLEPRLEAVFVAESYGYRPGRSAHQALEAVHKNVRNYAWVIDMDIKSFFDEVDHELLMKAVEKHVSESWVKMYIRRWLQAPVFTREGLEAKVGMGTPQGGVISPLLANLFLHYVLDVWLKQQYEGMAFVRYADDVVIHCSSESQSHAVLSAVSARLAACKLRLSEAKTKITYCKDYRREAVKGYATKFDFLGYSFKPMGKKSKRSSGMFLGFDCELSMKSRSRIIGNWKAMDFHRQTTLTLQGLATLLNPQIRGIINYYGLYNIETVKSLLFHLDFRLAKWVKNKYKGVKNSYQKAHDWLRTIKSENPTLFYHWELFTKPRLV